MSRIRLVILWIMYMLLAGCLSSTTPSIPTPTATTVVGTPKTRVINPTKLPTTVVSLQLGSEITKPGTIWLGNLTDPTSTAIIFPDGKTDLIHVAVRSVASNGMYAIYRDSNATNTAEPKIANLMSGATVKLQTPTGFSLFMVEYSPNFVFSPDNNQFVYLLIASGKKDWQLVSANPQTGQVTKLLQDSDFQKSSVRLRPDETLVPFDWNPQDALYLQSGRLNTDANFGTYSLNPQTHEWQRFDTAGVPAISNAGRQLAYVAYDPQFPHKSTNGPNVVKVIELATGATQVISSQPALAQDFVFPLLPQVAWSPNDQQILFLERDLTLNRIALHIANPSQGTYEPLGFERDGSITDLKWNAAGIFYIVSNDQETKLKHINPRTKEPQLIARVPGRWTRILRIW